MTPAIRSAGVVDEVSLPEIGDMNAYALEISGRVDGPGVPRRRHGDRCRRRRPSAVADRVVVCTAAGEVMAKQLARRSARRVELKSLNPAHKDRSFDLRDVALDSSYRVGEPLTGQATARRFCPFVSRWASSQGHRQ